MNDFTDRDTIVPKLPKDSREDMVEWAEQLNHNLETLEDRTNSGFNDRDMKYKKLQDLIQNIEKEIDDLKKMK